MRQYTLQEINNIVEAFSQKQLPKTKWNHTAHIIVALWHNWHFDFEEAFEKVKAKIIEYNISVGTVNSETSGYHDTLTKFWMLHTKSYLDRGHFDTLNEALNKFLNSEESNKDLPLKYYSKELLFSKKCRLKWESSDIASLKFISPLLSKNSSKI